MADIGNLVSHGEIQFASVRKVLSIQSFHHPAKAFNQKLSKNSVTKLGQYNRKWGLPQFIFVGGKKSSRKKVPLCFLGLPSSQFRVFFASKMKSEVKGNNRLIVSLLFTFQEKCYKILQKHLRPNLCHTHPSLFPLFIHFAVGWQFRTSQQRIVQKRLLCCLFLLLPVRVP